jgi:hypothetical protein
VIVNVKVVEGERTRVQAYEGVCIGRSGGGLNESFTVRKISYGEGVERVFPVMSPMIDSIKVVRPRQGASRPSCITCASCAASRPRYRREAGPRQPPSASNSSRKGRDEKRGVWPRAFLLPVPIRYQPCQSIDCGGHGRLC